MLLALQLRKPDQHKTVEEDHHMRREQSLATSWSLIVRHLGEILQLRRNVCPPITQLTLLLPCQLFT